jgi:hypothetical protein
MNKPLVIAMRTMLFSLTSETFAWLARSVYDIAPWSGTSLKIPKWQSQRKQLISWYWIFSISIDQIRRVVGTKHLSVKKSGTR